jgi:putative redox protein
MIYKLTGQDLSVDKVREAVELSMTKFCGVSAMISKVVPIFYTIVINGEVEHRGQAKFW